MGYYGVMLRAAIYLVISVIAVVAAVACGSEEPPGNPRVNPDTNAQCDD